MNNQKNNLPAGRQEKSLQDREKRMLPFVIEFVKFSSAFAIIIAVALITLHIASTAL